MSWPMLESRLAVGSSARMTVGSLASARAMATRCFSPAGELVGSVVAAVASLDLGEEVVGSGYGWWRR